MSPGEAPSTTRPVHVAVLPEPTFTTGMPSSSRSWANVPVPVSASVESDSSIAPPPPRLASAPADTVPPSTKMPPPKLLAPESVSVPVPPLRIPPLPPIDPANVLSAFVTPIVIDAPPFRNSCPVPPSVLIVWLKPLKSTVPAPPICSVGAVPNTLAMPANSVPPLAMVAPEKLLSVLRVSVPAPVLVRLPVPVRSPEKVALVVAEVSTVPPPAPRFTARPVTNAPLVVSASVPEVVASPSVTSPSALPSAPLAATLSVLPPATTVPPLYEFVASPRISVPPPATFSVPPRLTFAMLPAQLAVFPAETLNVVLPSRRA